MSLNLLLISADYVPDSIRKHSESIALIDLASKCRLSQDEPILDASMLDPTVWSSFRYEWNHTKISDGNSERECYLHLSYLWKF